MLRPEMHLLVAPKQPIRVSELQMPAGLEGEWWRNSRPVNSRIPSVSACVLYVIGEGRNEGG